jgi:RHS repeat-associated protein
MKKHLILALLATAAPAFPALAQSAAAPYMSASRFDTEGRVTGTISAPEPNGHHLAVRNTYDAAGRLIKVEKGELAAWQADSIAPASWTGFTVFQTLDSTYDAMGRKLTDKLSANGTAYSLTQMSYDGAGRLQCTAVRMNPAAFASLPADACTLGAQGSDGPDRITRNVYDAAGRVTVVKKAVGTALEQDYVSYSYTGNSKIATLTDANGGTATMTYDGHDRQARWVFPSKVTAGVSDPADYEEYGYDANSNRTSLRKRDGQTISYAYDALNRVASKDLPGTSGDVAYAYDLQSLQLSATFSASGQGIATAYDNAGRITSTTTSVGGSAVALAFQSDANGNRTRIAFPDGAAYDSAYDGLNRLQSVSQGASAIVSLAYDAQGERSALTGAGVSTGYGYDAVGRLSSMGTDLAGTGGDVSVTFARNAASQITSRAGTNDAYAVNNLAAGNRTYSVNGQNEYRTAAGAAVTYDANGNLTSDGSTMFTYDAENRLVSASGAKNAALTYDPQGRLSTITSAGVTTRFVYDGDRLVAEYDSGGNMLRRYVHTNGVDEPIMQIEGATTADAAKRYLVSDERGSIAAITAWGGNPIAINSYDEYGAPGTANQGRFQYTGQAWFPELGLYYYKARWYNPYLTTFMQPDPLGYQAGPNVYEPFGDDPIDNRDPSGMFAAGCGSYTRYDASGCRSEPQYDPMKDPGVKVGIVTPDSGKHAKDGVLEAGESLHGRAVRREIERYDRLIYAVASTFGLKPSLIKAIIYEEQTHRTPGERTLENLGIGHTVGLGQVTVGKLGFTREQLLNPYGNILAMGLLLREIAREHRIDPMHVDASLATRYNCGSCRQISDYGRRVERFERMFK